MRVTCLTVTIAMGTSSGLGSGDLGFLLPLGQLLSACLPSLLHGHWSECAGNWSVFLRCFCSGGTLTVFMVELCGRQSHFPLSCYDVLYRCAFYFTLFCLFASIIFTTNYVRFLPQSHTRNQAIAATAFSCIRPGPAPWLATHPALCLLVQPCLGACWSSCLCHFGFNFQHHYQLQQPFPVHVCHGETNDPVLRLLLPGDDVHPVARR